MFITVSGEYIDHDQYEEKYHKAYNYCMIETHLMDSFKTLNSKNRCASYVNMVTKKESLRFRNRYLNNIIPKL